MVEMSRQMYINFLYKIKSLRFLQLRLQLLHCLRLSRCHHRRHLPLRQILQRLYRGRHVPVASEEDDGKGNRPLGEQLLQVQAAGTRHVHVQEQAARHVVEAG